MRFVDEVEIVVASGRGGDGCVSFRREKFVPRGGPDGGDGGKGGDLVFHATRQRNTLVDFRWNRRYEARNGQPGMGNRKTGADGASLVLDVPIGTVITDLDSEEVLADLDAEGATFVLEGGRGGLGNWHFRSATRRTPDFATEGRDGHEVAVRLELKLMADVGLLGFPNAGKSTFISRISAARPKIADYPFTTLVPNLGVVRIDEGQSFVVADIPGLIEGAADGAGLGHQFLKHVERCGLYIHLVSCETWDGSPGERFATLNDELRQYDDALLERPQLVALTKIDTLSAEERKKAAKALAKAAGCKVFAISSVTGEGIPELVTAAWHVLQSQRADEDEDEAAPDPWDALD